MGYTTRPGYEPPATGKGSKLTAKQEAFVNEYMIDYNGSASCLRAGYKTKNPIKMATELLAHPLVKREIAARRKERREKSDLSVDYVIQKLVSIVEDTEEGNPQAALRGLELLGKHLAMFRERTEISGPDGDAIKMEQKVQNDVQDFTSRLSRLAAGAGEGGVTKLPVGRREG